MKKLSLNKETIANLNTDSMNSVKGGYTPTACLSNYQTFCILQQTCYCDPVETNGLTCALTCENCGPSTAC